MKFIEIVKGLIKFLMNYFSYFVDLYLYKYAHNVNYN